MTGFMWASLTPALPEIVLALSGLVLLAAGAFLGNDGTRAICWAVTAAFALAALFLLGLDWERSVTLGGLFVMDGFGGIMKLFILAGLIDQRQMHVVRHRGARQP